MGRGHGLQASAGPDGSPSTGRARLHPLPAPCGKSPCRPHRPARKPSDRPHRPRHTAPVTTRAPGIWPERSDWRGRAGSPLATLPVPPACSGRCSQRHLGHRAAPQPPLPIPSGHSGSSSPRKRLGHRKVTPRGDKETSRGQPAVLLEKKEHRDALRLAAADATAATKVPSAGDARAGALGRGSRIEHVRTSPGDAAAGPPSACLCPQATRPSHSVPSAPRAPPRSPALGSHVSPRGAHLPLSGNAPAHFRTENAQKGDFYLDPNILLLIELSRFTACEPFRTCGTNILIRIRS